MSILLNEVKFRELDIQRISLQESIAASSALYTCSASIWDRFPTKLPEDHKDAYNKDLRTIIDNLHMEGHPAFIEMLNKCNEPARCTYLIHNNNNFKSNKALYKYLDDIYFQTLCVQSFIYMFSLLESYIQTTSKILFEDCIKAHIGTPFGEYIKTNSSTIKKSYSTSLSNPKTNKTDNKPSWFQTNMYITEKEILKKNFKEVFAQSFIDMLSYFNRIRNIIIHNNSIIDDYRILNDLQNIENEQVTSYKNSSFNKLFSIYEKSIKNKTNEIIKTVNIIKLSPEFLFQFTKVAGDYCSIFELEIKSK
ncbi:MAG: hypothetical protein E7211_14200 [Clostridium lundense]|nr:hypothetical protein [Clostridium lundense]